MIFSTRAEYGVRVMIALGRRRGQGPVSLAEIADSEGLPLGYLEHLVAGLRKAGLVSSTRGARGGYELGRTAAKITMAEVVNALEGSVTPMQCFTEPATGRVLCNHDLEGYDHCATRLLWTRVQGGVHRALAETTLEELVQFAEHGTARSRRKPVSRTGGGRARRSTSEAVGI